MNQSATGPRERRRTETTRTLISLARRATASTGLTGFTIEELCEQAGVSRRTFFNYFASKEDAVLGFALNLDTSDIEEMFVRMRPLTPPGELSSNLLTDFAALTEARWAALEIDHAAAAELMAAAEREPRLIAHMIERHRTDERNDITLVARREGVTDDDPRIVAMVQLVGHLARVAVPASLDPDHPQDFRDVLERHLAAVHALFTTQTMNDPESTR
ncbi:TetR/AcrR family transcriptional regulator [Microbacterium hominis]|uniref:Helix-turn-helix transcriptional regulator n=1 Tax=Microbacterium hominis TaxID=162426 RepID=A0A7D4Q1A2_9MICO|nr:TetR/AcrR family transcriptional regulator [Microbacterium hominis]QKJ18711.1 helix-turn-helix transcriptional regulator [Microbacterium hominis]